MADEAPWRRLSEAPRLSGLDREALRSRARRSLLPSRKNNRGELLVQVPSELLTEVDRDGDYPSNTEIAGMRVALADLTAEVTELQTALARSEAQRDAAESVALAQVEAKAQVVAELREQVAWLRRPWWRRWL